MINYEETELRLGLPGSKTADSEGFKTQKRGFLQTVDLKLNLASKEPAVRPSKGSDTDVASPLGDPAKPPSKAQVVGWPPIRSFRKNVMTVQKSSVGDSEEKETGTRVTAAFVKVSVDGAPYLRKVDLKLYGSYRELSSALSKMLGSFVNESAVDFLNGPDYVQTYEDKDGDWMLVGDVPWEMFVDSCKRLRIMKSSDGLRSTLECPTRK